MGNICFKSSDKLKSRKLSINVLYNKQKVLKIKKLAIKNKKWTNEDIVKVLDKTEKELAKRGIQGKSKRPHGQRFFRQKVHEIL